MPSLKKVYGIIEEGRRLIEEHYNYDERVRTLSVRLLEFHARYAELLADFFIEKAQGHDEEAKKICEAARLECGARELEFERWYDHGMFFSFLKRLADSISKPSDNEAIYSV